MYSFGYNLFDLKQKKFVFAKYHFVTMIIEQQKNNDILHKK